MLALKCEHVRFLQNFIVWPKCPQTETARAKRPDRNGPDRNDQTLSARPKSRVPVWYYKFILPCPRPFRTTFNLHWSTIQPPLIQLLKIFCKVDFMKILMKRTAWSVRALTEYDIKIFYRLSHLLQRSACKIIVVWKKKLFRNCSHYRNVWLYSKGYGTSWRGIWKTAILVVGGCAFGLLVETGYRCSYRSKAG